MTDESQQQLVTDALKTLVEERREFLIIESGPYYIQFAAVYANGVQQGGEDRGRSFWDLYAEYGLYAEAISDEYLEPSAHLGADGAARLERLGWTRPSNQPNWSRIYEMRGPVDCEAIARAVIATFVAGFRTSDPFRFEVGNRIR